jgi:iron complex transport system substrate-binding protein
VAGLTTSPGTPRKHRTLAIGCLALALALPARCPGQPVTDDRGQPVTLPQPARRVVTLSPHAAELLFHAGAGDRLVGSTAHSDYPPAARAAPRIGDATRLDREAILALAPDLVIAWPSGNRPGDLDWLQRRGLPLYHSDPPTLAAIADNLRDIGVLTGTGEPAGRAADAFHRDLEQLRRRYRERPVTRVFYQLWPRPPMTLGRNHLLNEVLALCRARNLFDNLAGSTATVSREAVLRADPQAIVAAVSGPEEDPFAPWRVWPALTAVREGRLLRIPAELLHRPTPALLRGAAALCRGLHGDRPGPPAAAETGPHQ